MMGEAHDYEKEKMKSKLRASLYGKESRIYFSKSVLRAIKKPKHICLKINRDMTSFLVMPCDDKNPMSFPVPENLFSGIGVKMRISSQSFLLELFVRNGLDLAQTYRVDGVYFPQNNAVVFQMNNAAVLAEQEDTSG